MTTDSRRGGVRPLLRRSADSPTDEDILGNGCVVCGSAADAEAFSPLKTA